MRPRKMYMYGSVRLGQVQGLSENTFGRHCSYVGLSRDGLAYSI